MPTYRVTQSTVTTHAMSGLQKNLDKLQRLQTQLSSGKLLAKPSDAPANVADALQFRSSIKRAEQYGKNADDGLAWLGTADTALSSAVDIVSKVKNLALGAGNAAIDSAGRDAMAAEVDGLRESLIGLANTKYIDRSIFAGTANVAQAYNASGVWQGSAAVTNSIDRAVGEGVKVQVNLIGPDVFGVTNATGRSVFDVLSDVANHLRNGDVSGLTTTDLTNLDQARNQIQNQQSTVGARYNRLETMKTRTDDMQLTLKDQLSNVEDIDLPKTIVDLQLQQTAYQAALAATAKSIQPSLLDFLR